MEIKIPCEVLVRLSKLFDQPTDNDVTDYMMFRFENGKIIVTNRQVLICEKIANFAGVFHMKFDRNLIKQCQTETMFKSDVTLMWLDAIQALTAVTTLGYQHDQNLYVPINACPKINDWQNLLTNPATSSSGVMFWRKSVIVGITDCAPSGNIYFPEHIDTTRPIVVRDEQDDTWFAVFIPGTTTRDLKSARVPTWMKQ